MALVDIVRNLTVEIFRHFIKGTGFHIFYLNTTSVYMFNYFLVLQIQMYFQTKQKLHVTILAL